MVTELGFDVRNDGQCRTAAVYRLRDSLGTSHEFTCASGTPESPSPGNWTRLRFPLAIGLTIDDLRVIFVLSPPESGFTYLDNLDINGTLIGKPGSNR